jgi:serine/threonine-protein kinase
VTALFTALAPTAWLARDAMDPQVGQLINNKYRLLRLIGEGGMGSVFEARHELLGTTVALKFLHTALSRRRGLVDRFLQEAQVSARIKSPHVVRVSDVDRTPEGLAYMVMEYAEGETLQRRYEILFEEGKRLSYGEAFALMFQLSDGLAAAHKEGIVHRDLKPDNVILSTDPKGQRLVKILDFGIAKLRASGEIDRGLTRPGSVMGTPEYMAPEQAFSADKVDARADIFSLGVMFFEMLAGRRPVGGDNAHAIAAQYLEGKVGRLTELAPALDAELATAVHKAMAPKPDERWQSIAELVAAIEPFAPEPPRSFARAPVAAGPRLVRAPAPKKASGADGAPSQAAASAEAVATPAATPERTPAAAPEPTPAIAAASTPDSMPTRQERSVPPQAPAEPHPAPAEAAAAPPAPVAEPPASPGGTAPLPSEAASGERPGATVVGEPFAAPAVPAPPAANAPAARPATPGPYVASLPSAYASPYAAPPRRKGMSILSMLLTATLVTGAVAGGLYGWQYYQQIRDGAPNGDDPAPPPRPPPPSPPVVNVDPPPVEPTTSPPLEPPVEPTADTTSKPPTPTPGKPPPAGKGGFPPPFVLPTALPSIALPPLPSGFPPIFPLPGQPPPAQPKGDPKAPPQPPPPSFPIPLPFPPPK